MKKTLEDIIEQIPFDSLPANWTSFDLSSFSRGKHLWDYQKHAVENALKVLWKYYEDFEDYGKEERTDANIRRKAALAGWYRNNGQKENLDLKIKDNSDLLRLLGEYYRVAPDNTLSYEQFLNRACFWMATGSGKTLVIVKLVEALQGLIKRKEIPAHDILILTHRDDLIEHLKMHLKEFNESGAGLTIYLKELREYAETKRNTPSLFRDREMTVFYYRSDNMSNEQKEKIIDYRDIEILVRPSNRQEIAFRRIIHNVF